MRNTNTKKYDLEDRTLEFAKRVRTFLKGIPKTLANIEDAKQLIRASASVGANYIEANEALSKKDFTYRTKICRKEARESKFFLHLIDVNFDKGLETEKDSLINESTELTKIFGSIITNTKN